MIFDYLYSKVSHKIIILFIAAAMLPLLLTALLSYLEVSRLIEEERFNLLESENRQLSKQTHERLISIQKELQQRLKDIRSRKGLQHKAEPSHLPAQLTALGILDARTGTTGLLEGTNDVFADITFDTDSYSAERFTLVTLDNTDSSKAGIYLARKLQPNPRNSRYLIAKVNPDYLWPEKYLNVDTRYTVFNKQGRLLFQDQKSDFSDHALHLLRFSRIEERQRIRIESETYLANRRDMILPELFQSQEWTIFSLQPARFTITDINRFRIYFIAPISLVVILVCFISLIVIRRSFAPVTNLLEGTRQVARNNFDHHIEVNSKDEFATLANSFNNMTSKLKYLFDTSKTLSNIDQLILANADVDNIASTVLSGLRTIIPSETVSFILAAQTSQDSNLVYTLNNSSSDYVKQAIGTPIDVNSLPEFIPASQALSKGINTGFLKILASNKCLYIHSIPLKDQNQILGWLVASNPSAFSLNVETYRQAKEYSDRVTVALAALTRSNLLAHQANMDSLTGIPNRRQMKILSNQAIRQAVSNNSQGALLFIDLDRFKNVNDAFGHSIGDRLLVEAANRLSGCTDGNQIVSRFGGDEFAILMPEINDIGPVEQLVMKVIKSLSTPFQIDDFISYVGASIGVSLFPSQADNFDDLLQMADTAMYQAKREGRDNYVIYRPEFGKKSLNRSVLEHEIRRGIQENAFEVYYQPKVSAWNGKIKGFEALLRWQHKKIGFVSPVDIISVAEESALINDLGDWLIREVCGQIKKWQRLISSDQTFAINVSSKQLMNHGFLERLTEIIKQTGINPRSLEIEITESLFLADKNNTALILNQIHDLGIKISIDDFGTGFSSLGYLSDLPIDILKIDRCFIERLDMPDNNGAIVKSILAMASNLNLKVVAEGVETSSQLAFLVDALCDEIQGYYFSKPITAADAGEMLKNANQFVVMIENVKTQRSQVKAG